MNVRRYLASVARLAPLWLSLACGGGAAPQSFEESIAKAVTMESRQKKQSEAADNAEQARLAAAAKAKAEHEARVVAEIDAAAVLPATLPASIDAACDAVVDSYDGFLKRGAESDVLRWHDGRRKKMGERRTACMAAGNVQVASCQAAALAAELPLLAGIERTDAARRVMTRCSDKFGKP